VHRHGFAGLLDEGLELPAGIDFTKFDFGRKVFGLIFNKKFREYSTPETTNISLSEYCGN
jgi:hypothetical protein